MKLLGGAVLFSLRVACEESRQRASHFPLASFLLGSVHPDRQLEVKRESISARERSRRSRARELAVCAFAEPIHMEDLWWVRDLLAHFEPVAEIISHVVATEGSMAMGSRRVMPTSPVAAAVVSKALVAPTKTPCCQSNDS